MKTNRLLTKQVVSTYAGTLLEAAKLEERVFVDVKSLEGAVRIIRGHHELWDMISSEQIDPQVRHNVVVEVFGETEPEEVVKTLAVMAERGDLSLMGRVAESYRELAEEELNVVITEVTTAVPLDDHLRQVIKDKLAAQLGKGIHLEEKVDPSIIGGVIVNAQGKRIDASIASQLTHARAVLSKNVSTGGEE